MKNVAFLCAVILLLFACKSNDKAQSPKTSSPKEKGAISPTEIEDTLNLDPNFEAFYETIAPKKQKFVVKGNKANSLKCKNGTKLEIPANTFCYKDGTPVKGLVGIEVKECLTLGDIISENLSTRSNGKILETGGMIHITARSKGRDLKVRSGKEFEILFPAKKRKEGMETFYGERKANGEMNWSLQNVIKENSDIISSKETGTSNINTGGIRTLGRVSSGYGWSISYKTTGMNNEKVNWNFRDTTGDLFTYFEENFESTTEMDDFFRNGNLESKFEFLFNEKGKIIDIECVRCNDDEYDKRFIDFLESVPAIRSENLWDQYKNWKVSLGFRNGYPVADPVSIYDAELEENRKKFQTKSLENLSASQLNYYAMTANSLGWINCDRFYNSKAPKIDYYVKTEEPENTRFFLVFKSISAVMVGAVVNGRAVFKNIPINLPVRIVGIRSKGNKPQMGIMNTKTSRSSGNLSNFREFNLTELNKQMSL